MKAEKEMGDFKKNPKKPYEVKVPNKIRKHIAMHERAGVSRQREIKSGLAKILPTPPVSVPVIRKRGSFWRFADGVKNLLQKKLLLPEDRK